MQKLRPWGVLTVLVLFIPLFASIQAHAQSLLYVYDVDPSHFPLIRAKFFGFDRSMQPIANPKPGDFQVLENGIARTVDDVTCSTARNLDLSVVLTIDVSSSMSDSKPGRESNMDLAKAAAVTWINTIALNNSECAITSFDDKNYLNTDFTNDRGTLQAAIGSLKPQGGTNFDAGFLDSPAGALVVARNGRHKRIIIFLTDGQAAGRETTIIDEAARDNVTIYCVTLQMSTPEILQKIAARTGGRSFGNVETRADIERVYRTILQLAQNPDACQISWTSAAGCDLNRAVTITHMADGAASPANYVAPSTSVPGIGFDVRDVAFGAVAPGTTHDTTITVTARTLPIRITRITSGNPLVTVDDVALQGPIDLLPGESKQITLRFAPTDSTPEYARIDVTTDPPLCSESYVYVSGGFPNVRPARRTMAVLAPNGGEQLMAGIETNISWKAALPGDTVGLDYSIDGGATWAAIARAGTGGSARWKVPATPSGTCLARATHARTADTLHTLRGGLGPINAAYFAPDGVRVFLAGANVGGEIWDGTHGAFLRSAFDRKSPITTTAVDYAGGTVLTAATDRCARIWSLDADTALVTLKGHTRSIIAASFNADGTRVATASADSTVRIWNPKTGECIRTIQAHNCAVAGVTFAPGGERIATCGADSRIKIWSIGSGILQTTILPPQGTVAACFTAVAFSPDGRRIVSTMNDATARIWDAQSGKLLLTLTGHQGKVLAACYDLGGGRVITGGADGTARVWDASTGALLRTMRAHGTSITSVAVNPHDGRILTAGSDGMARIWEEDTSDEHDASDAFWTIARPRLEVLAPAVDFGAVELGSGRDTTIDVMVRNLDPKPLIIDKVRIRGDDAGAFTVVGDTAAITLAPGGAGAMTLRFTPARIGAAAVSLDFARTGAGPLGSAELRGMGIAQSTPGIAAARSITFGPMSCRETFTDAILAIGNTGGAPLIITNAAFSGTGKGSFSVFPAFSRLTIAPGDTARLTLRFTPVDADIGPVSAALALESNAPDNTTLVVELQARRERIAFTTSTKEIDLGTLCPNQGASAMISLKNTGTIATGIRGSVEAPFAIEAASWTIASNGESRVRIGFDGLPTPGEHRATLTLVDSICGLGLSIPVRVRVSPATVVADPLKITTTAGTTARGSIIVRNGSDREITVTSAHIADPRFDLSAVPMPLTIPAGGSVSISVGFSPSDTGVASAAIELSGDPCSLAATLPIAGVGVPVGTTVEMPIVEAAPGERVSAPLRIVESKTSIFSAARKFTATIRFNASLLEPAPGMPRGTIRDGERIITLSGERADGSDVLANLELIAALGNADSTVIHIDEFVWTDASSRTATHDGLFRLRGICRNNGARLVTVGGGAALKESYPNPAQSSTRIEFETSEAGITKLFLMDPMGKEVAVVAEGNIAPGVHSADLDLTSLASGIYFYVLQTPSERLSRRLDVRK